ncbi:glutathione-disulfide reductase [Hutsoniella sourekii]|uniref:glutathione-disulfide reductase n=1 Tax=Hutsoniella sourekii TaxID=87650 RepID=UPI0004803C9C|nr:glutathione-disulfide reductase [Hutsoniella sourekii]
MTKQYDLLVLGAGSGGIASANRAAEYGAKVAIIEDKQVGGTCVNIGCVPKKVTWYAAEVADVYQKYGQGYGFTADSVDFNYQEFLKARDGYVSRSRSSYFNGFEKRGVDLIEGRGRFISDHEIEVNGEVYRADNIIIATGKRPAPLQQVGSHLVESSDDVFAWQELPQSVVFIGAGYIAVELSQAYHALGVETHLAFRHERFLRKFDKMLTDNLMQAMEKDGPILHPKTNFTEFRKNTEGKIECLIDGQVILTVDKVVAAIGRVPNTEDIGLEKTNIQLDDSGHIQINDQHETQAKGVYAIGDVVKRVDLTPVAIRAGRQISEYLFNQADSSAIDYENIPSVIFSHPTIGTIGMTEDEAVATYGQDQIKVYTNRFYSMYASAAWHREACDFKLITLGDEEKVIGLHGIGQGVDEMIQGFGVAIKMGASKQDFDSVVAIHPTGAEEFVTMR